MPATFVTRLNYVPELTTPLFLSEILFIFWQKWRLIRFYKTEATIIKLLPVIEDEYMTVNTPTEPSRQTDRQTKSW